MEDRRAMALTPSVQSDRADLIGSASGAIRAIADKDREVMVCGDTVDLARLRAGLEAEGLVVHHAHEFPGPAAPSAHAVVWCVTRCLTERLAELRHVRRLCPDVPLLVVCNAGRELDHVLAFEIGADDVLDAAWPVSVVAARLRAQWRQALRWRQDNVEQEEMRFGRLVLRWRDRSVRLVEQRIALTDGEFDVLWCLARRAGQAVTRMDLLRRIRGTPQPLVDRSIDSRVYRIRQKLGDADRTAPRIRSVRNCGYLFSPLGW